MSSVVRSFRYAAVMHEQIEPKKAEKKKATRVKVQKQVESYVSLSGKKRPGGVAADRDALNRSLQEVIAEIENVPAIAKKAPKAQGARLLELASSATADLRRVSQSLAEIWQLLTVIQAPKRSLTLHRRGGKHADDRSV
jgi:hypothetical protein